MTKKTLKEIEDMLNSIQDEKDPFIQILEEDERKGAQDLLQRWNRRQEQARKAQAKFVEMTAFERRCREQGYPAHCRSG